MNLNFPGSKIVAKILAIPVVRWVVMQYAFRTPHKHLYDEGLKPVEGGWHAPLYMGRWRLVDEEKTIEHHDGGLGYENNLETKRTRASRALEFLSGYQSTRLHHINRPDHDRDLHNHPFEYRTFVIKGWYTEEYITKFGTTGTRTIKAGDTVASNGGFHRIADISPGGVWTVFVMGKNTGTWGFRVWDKLNRKYKFVESKKYFLERKYNKETIRAVHAK